MAQDDSRERPIRVLHVIGTLDRGGIETWLMNVWRRADQTSFEHSVLVNNGTRGIFGDELQRLGVPVHYAPHPADFFRYRDFVNRALREYGPYDIVHSHVYDLSGLVLKLAAAAGVPVRIAHSHNTQLARHGINGLVRHLTRPLQSYWIRKYATSLAAVSDEAGKALFGDSEGSNDCAWSILPLGIDLAPFRRSSDARVVRSGLGLPHDAFVVGHVGAFSLQKNHTFIVDVFSELQQLERRAWLLLVGDGPLQAEAMVKVEQLGLKDRVIFAGVRDDVPVLMMNAMDVFLFPSRFEGLGLVLVEAQAAGLPCVVADTVPNEARLIDDLFDTVPLATAAPIWAERVMEAREAGIDRHQALTLVERSKYSIEGSVVALEAFYRSCICKVAASGGSVQ